MHIQDESTVVALLSLVLLVGQPLSFYALVANRSRWSIASSLVLFVSTMTYLATEWHRLVEPYPDAMFCWGPCVLLLARYTHALCVGGPAFARHYGLLTIVKDHEEHPDDSKNDAAARKKKDDDCSAIATSGCGNNEQSITPRVSFQRVLILSLSTSILIFRDTSTSRGDISTSSNSSKSKLPPPLPYRRGNSWTMIGEKTLEAGGAMALMIAICHGLVASQERGLLLSSWLPVPLQRLLYMYLVCLSEEIGTLLFELPLRLLLKVLRYQDQHVSIQSNLHYPFFTTSPRDLWHRWSQSIAYPLRHGLYSNPSIQVPIQQYLTGEGVSCRQVSTLLLFTVNAMIHMLGLGLWFQGTNRWNADLWVPCLIVFPMITFGIQDYVLGPQGILGLDKRSPSYKVGNIIVLWAAMIRLQPAFADACMLPSDLYEFSVLALNSF